MVRNGILAAVGLLTLYALTMTLLSLFALATDPYVQDQALL